MPLTTQTKILRVLQEGEFERVGGSDTVHVNVRVLAATNRDLQTQINNGEFRADLFYRLNVVRIRMPALRERRDDIPLIIEHMLKRVAREQNLAPRSISTTALRLLEKYHWPGNVRELENVIRRAFVVAKGPVVVPSDLPPEIAGATAAPGDPASAQIVAAPADAEVADLAKTLFQWARRNPKNKIVPTVERELLIQALAETHGNQAQAARLLGMTRATLRKRVEKFGILKELKIQ